MKKIGRWVLWVILLCTIAQSAAAQDATSYTYALNGENQWEMIPSAYKPVGTLLSEQALNKPADICYFDGCLYVADANGGRVLVYSLEDRACREIAPGSFSLPTGVYVNELGLFVADRGHGCAYRLDHQGNVLMQYEKPSSYSYGSSTVYLPQKIAADTKGNVYVLSSGTYQGLVQFDETGEFVGFFATNTANVTLAQRLQDLFFTEEQKAKLFDITPTGFNNLTIHPEEELVYTLTPGETGRNIKKHSIAGANILSDYRVGEQRYADIALDAQQRIYTVTASGIVYVYSRNGELLYSFGGQATAVDVTGYAMVITGIAVDDAGCIYLLDEQRGFVHTYVPTDFALRVNRALDAMNAGEYELAKANWAEVLMLAPNFRAAYNSLGLIGMQQGDYEASRRAYRLANNRQGYSEAQWELRNNWINEYFALCLILVIVAGVCLKAAAWLLRRSGLLAKWDKRKQAWMQNPLMQGLNHVMYTVRHPMDSYYYVKHAKRCSVRSAWIVYILSFAVFIWDQTGKGYIFNTLGSDGVSPVFLVAVFAVPLALWVVCSYMVSSVMYGEGHFRSGFIGGAYMLSPYLVFMPVLCLLSYVLTLNEAFVMEMGTLIIWGYVLIQLFFSVKEVNNYSPRRTLGGIAISLFFIVVVVMAFSVVYMLCSEFAEMIITMVKEVIYRA